MNAANSQRSVGLDVEHITKTLEELEADIAHLREELKKSREEAARKDRDEFLLAYV